MNNPNFNPRDLQENDPGSLSEAELNAYFSALNAAYPRQKKSVKDQVMAKIRSEADAAALAKKIAMKRRSSFVKWGSLAACIVLIFTVCLNVIPSIIMNSADEESSYDAFSGNAISNYDLAPVDRTADEDMNAAPEKSNQADGTDGKHQDYLCEPDNDDASSMECESVSLDFESRIKTLLSETVDPDLYAGWMDVSGYSDISDWDIDSFVEHFGTEDEVLESIKISVQKEIDSMS